MNRAAPNPPVPDPAGEPPDLKAALAPYLERVEAELARRVPEDPSRAFAESLTDYLSRPGPVQSDRFVVYDPIRHVLRAGGKRIRPILCLLAAEAVCSDADRALPTAAGLELLHTFTLVHDDVMDNDLTRRGRPTVHALWGGPIAITAGDGLNALAFEAFADNAERAGVDPATVIQVSRRAAQVEFELCAGQTQDLLFEEREEVPLEEYAEMIRLKTGVLLGLSTEAGARLAGASTADVEAFRVFGLELGMAFQVKDDLLDLVGTESELGKPVGSDLRAGKKTYPVLWALDTLTGKDRTRLLQILDTPEAQTNATMVAEALRILDQCGALQAAETHAQEHAERAKAALGRLDRVQDRTALGLLEAVADYVVQRRR